MKKTILVLAGNINQYNKFVRENNCREKCIYARTKDAIRGLRMKEIEVVGTFWDRKDAGRVYQEACERIYDK